MASRRAQPRPQLPQIRTQVTAAPVNTAVTPGNAGAPVAPVAPVAPLEANTQEATDLQNLSSAFGGLSRSLQQFGTATARKAAAEISFLKQQGREKEAKERRDAYERRMAASDLRTAERKLEQEINSQATEASQLIDIEKSMKDHRVAWFKGASEANYSLYNSPGFRTKLSELLGRRAAKLTYNESYWAKFFQNEDNALHEMGSAGKLFDSRTAELVKQGLSFIGDKNAYQANFLAGRSILRAKLVDRQEQFLADYVQEEVEANVTDEIIALVAEPEVPVLPPIAAAQGMPESPNDYTGPSRAEQVTGILDSLRGTHLQQTANKFVGEKLINAALNSKDIETFQRALDIYNKTETGPLDSRTLLSKVPANETFYFKKEKDLAVQESRLQVKNREKSWDSLVSDYRTVIESSISSESKKSDSQLAQSLFDNWTGKEFDGVGIVTREGDELVISAGENSGLPDKRFNIPKLIKNVRINVVSERAKQITNEVGVPRTVAYIQSSVENDFPHPVVRSYLVEGATVTGVGSPEELAQQAETLKTGWQAYKANEHDKHLLGQYKLSEEQRATYEAVDLIFSNKTLQLQFSPSQEDPEANIWTNIVQRIGKIRDAQSSPNAYEHEQLEKFRAEMGTFNPKLPRELMKDFTNAATLLHRLMPGANAKDILNDAASGFSSSVLMLGASGQELPVLKRLVPADVISGTHGDMDIPYDVYANVDDPEKDVLAIAEGKPLTISEDVSQDLPEESFGLYAGQPWGDTDLNRQLQLEGRKKRARDIVNRNKTLTLNEQLTHATNLFRHVGLGLLPENKGKVSAVSLKLIRDMQSTAGSYSLADEENVIIHFVPKENSELFTLVLRTKQDGLNISPAFPIAEVSLLNIADLAATNIERTQTDKWAKVTESDRSDFEGIHSLGYGRAMAPQKDKKANFDGSGGFPSIKQKRMLDIELAKPKRKRASYLKTENKRALQLAKPKDLIYDDSAWQDAPFNVRLARYGLLKQEWEKELEKHKAGDQPDTLDAKYDTYAKVRDDLVAQRSTDLDKAFADLSNRALDRTPYSNPTMGPTRSGFVTTVEDALWASDDIQSWLRKPWVDDARRFSRGAR